MNGINNELYSEILPGLYMGGTADDDVVDVAKPLKNLNATNEFDSVVTAYSWAQPMSWYVHENRFGFADGPINNETFVKVKELANWLHTEWKAGKRCLSRCQAGANRSGLILALVLMKEGFSARDAICLIKDKRGSFALGNMHFQNVLLSLNSKQDDPTNLNSSN